MLAAVPAAQAQRIVGEERRDDEARARVKRDDDAAARQHMRILLDDAGNRLAVGARDATRR